MPCDVAQHWVIAVFYIDVKVIGVYDSFGTQRRDVFLSFQKWANLSLTRGARRIVHGDSSILQKKI